MAEVDSNSELDFSFAYDVKHFSDRMLRIEIWDGVLDTKSENEIWISLSSKRKKMKTEDAAEKENALEAHTNSKEHSVDVAKLALDAHTNCKEKNVNCNMAPEQEEAMEMSDEDCDESNLSASSIVRTSIIHINSLILAAKSGVFYELFSSQPKESEHRNVTVRIHVSDEVAFFDLLSFIYSNTLSTRSYGLMKMIVTADKYKVSSCMKYCSKLLQSFEMSTMSAVSYLNLPFTVRMVEAVQPLIDDAKEYLISYFNNFDKQQELMMLPLLGIEVVLSSNDLRVPSEDIIYEFLIKWVAFHYSEPDERRRIMTTHLSRLMRFHYMSSKTLRNVMECPNLDSSVSSKLVLDALFFQAEPVHKQRALTASGDYSIERHYKKFPSRTAEFELTSPRVTVNVELKMEECIRLSTTRGGIFQRFYLNGEGLFLNMRYNIDPQTGYESFGLLLGMQSNCVRSAPIRVYYKFSAMQNPMGFISMHKGDSIFEGGTTIVECRDLFAMPWMDLMAEDCVYFINGSLHLIAKIMIVK